MPIRIIKKSTEPLPEVADLVPDAEQATVVQERTPEMMLASWQSFPSPHAKPTPCPFCNKVLIGHCTAAGWSTCPNVRKSHAQG